MQSRVPFQAFLLVVKKYGPNVVSPSEIKHENIVAACFYQIKPRIDSLLFIEEETFRGKKREDLIFPPEV